MIPDLSQPAEIDLTVSIVNWNTRDDLMECLASLIPEGERRRPAGDSFLLDGITCEVVLVDNASSDDSVQSTREHFPCVRIETEPFNLGFAAGQNIGMNKARGHYILLLNPDTVIHKGALNALTAFADTKSKGGVFGPKVLNPDGSLQASARSFPTLAAGIFRNSVFGRLFPNNKYTRDYLQADWDHEGCRTIDWLSGCALLIRRETAAVLNGLDEDYYMYVEDMDFCRRAWDAGYEVWYTADAVVTHKKARASDKAQARMLYHHHRSMYIFYIKHYREKAGILERIAAPAGIFLRGGYFILKNILTKPFCKAPRRA